MTYTNNLKRIRKEKGMTQRQVALMMSMQCESRLSQWENSSATPSIFNVLKLCEIYDVTAQEMFAVNPE